MEIKNVFGYKVKSNGKILKLNGEPMKYQKTIRIVWNGIGREVSYSRFVYYAFNMENFDFNDHSIVIIHKDNNKKNNRIENLLAVKRKDLIQGENSNSYKLTDKDVENIIKEYNDYGTSEHDPTKKCSYRKLAQKYGVSHTLIRGIIKGDFRNKDNYILK